MGSKLQNGIWSIASIDGNTKLDEFKLTLKNTNKETRFLGITETWLDNTLNNTSASIKGYEMKRVDKYECDIPIDKDSAGSIMIYISDKLSYTCRDIHVESKKV